MDKKSLEAFVREDAKSIKTESDLDDFRKMLTKVTVAPALNAEPMSALDIKNTILVPALTPAMATRVSQSSSMMERSISTSLAIVKPALNLNSSASTKLDSNPWTTRY